MTRSYFLAQINEWRDLIDLCRHYRCDICEDIIDRDQLDNYVHDDIIACINDNSWKEIRDMLEEIDPGFDYYRADGRFDYECLESYDFYNYKQKVLDWMDGKDMWEEEGSESAEPPEAKEPEAEEEDFTISDLMSMCGKELVAINRASEQRLQEEADAGISLLFAKQC